MNVKFTVDIVLISQNKGGSKILERDIIMVVCDTTGHFPGVENFSLIMDLAKQSIFKVR